MATTDLTSVLDEAGVSYELLSHAHTESALAEAQALGVSPDDVAKTLVVVTSSKATTAKETSAPTRMCLTSIISSLGMFVVESRSFYTFTVFLLVWMILLSECSFLSSLHRRAKRPRHGG